MFNKKEYMKEYYKQYYQKHKKEIQEKRIKRLKIRFGGLDKLLSTASIE